MKNGNDANPYTIPDNHLQCIDSLLTQPWESTGKFRTALQGAESMRFAMQWVELY